LQSILDGRTAPPPITQLVGYRLIAIDNGRVVFELEPGEHQYNPFASVHGGIVSTVLDSAMAAAVLSTLPVGLNCTTVELKVNLVHPITTRTGSVRCEGTVIHVGTRIATAEAKLRDVNNKLYAHAVSTCLILRVRDSK